MGRFANLSDAQGNTGGLYFLPGNYVVELTRIAMKANRKREDCFIVETVVRESDNPNRPVGCRPSWVVNYKQDAAPGNVKGFLGATQGITDVDGYVPEDGMSQSAFWDAVGELAVSNDQPLAGTVMRLTCVNIKTRAGNDFTKHMWGEVLEQPEAKSA